MFKREIKAVIFDMDGVITDTMGLHYLANKKIATELGLSFDKKANEKFKGISRMDVIKTLVNEAGLSLSQEELEELSERKNGYYKEYLKSISEENLIPDITSFIKELKQNGLKLAVASSSTNATTILEKTGVLDYFDYVVDSRKLKKGKPDPEIFLTAANALGIDYRSCIAIEDGEAGLVAIKQTPMFSIGIGDDEFMQFADWHVSSAKELSFDELSIRFNNFKKYIIGLDGGGTYIRSVLVDDEGHILSTVKSKGGASPIKNTNAKENVQNIILKTIKQSNLGIKDISCVIAGIADLNSEKDLLWAQDFTNIEGLKCLKLHLNDTVIAGRGSFLDGIGIIVVAGTGSMVTGFTEKGEILNNRTLKNHDARAGAVKFSSDLILEIIKNNFNETDKNFIEEVLNYFQVDSLLELKIKIADNLPQQNADLLHKISGISPLITKNAKLGSELCILMCKNAMKNLADGVKIVSEEFQTNDIKVSTIGSILNDEYMSIIFKDMLNSINKNLILQEPIFSPEKGAAILGLEKLNYDFSKIKNIK